MRPFVIGLFLKNNETDIVLVAPRGKSKRKYTGQVLDELNELYRQSESSNRLIL